MNQEHLNLVQAEIDGLNSVAESQRLHNMIAGDPDLRVAFEELQSVKLAIESLVEVDPPASLKASIMQALPQPERARSKSSAPASWWSGITDLVRLPKPISLAYAFSLGLIVAFVVSTVLMPPISGDGSDPISGAMISTGLAGYEILAEYELGEDEKNGRVRVARDRNRYIIEFVWENGEPVQARVYFEEEWMTGFTGTHIVGPSNDFKTTTTEKEVEIEGSGNIKEYVSLGRRELDEEDRQLSIEVRSGNRSLLRRTLFLGGDE